MENYLIYIPEIVATLGAIWTMLKLHDKIVDFLQKKKSKLWLRIYALAGQAVVQVSEEYVNEIKKGKADGKLTKDEAKKARDLALQKLLELAKADGLDLLKSGFKEMLPWIIEKIVQKFKKGDTGGGSIAGSDEVAVLTELVR
jgi:hypothetical protein